MDGKKPAEILDRAAAADASGQTMTSDKQGRRLKRRRSRTPPEINERGAASAGLTF